MNKRGYILYEVCLVLMVVATIIIFFPAPSDHSDERILSEFVRRLESDLIYTKYHSSTTIDGFDIQFSQTSPQYSIFRSIRLLRTVNYDERITLVDTFTNHKIRIYNGMIEKEGKIVISCGRVSFILSVLPKGGVIVVEKQTGSDTTRAAFFAGVNHVYRNPYPIWLISDKHPSTIIRRRETDVTANNG